MTENKSYNSEAEVLDEIVTTPYKYGFTTNLETEEFEKGLSKEIVSKIPNREYRDGWDRVFGGGKNNDGRIVTTKKPVK